MFRFSSRAFQMSAAALLLLVVASAAPAQELPPAACTPPVSAVAAPPDPHEVLPFAGVGLKIRDEVAPAGSLAQMKVYITEPMPIFTGSGRFSYRGFERIEGIALSTPSDDGYGLALFDDEAFALSFVSPSGTFGMEPDYPIVTIVGKIPEGMRTGSQVPFTIDPNGLRFTDATGAVYPTEFKNGVLTVGSSVAVHDVLPGSATLPAGSVVTILGANFRRDTRVKFNETDLTSVRYFGPDRLDVTLAVPANMHGMRIRLDNKEKPFRSRTTYFSYHRTKRADGSSADPVLSRVVPVFPRGTVSSATVDVANGFVGLAIQNIEASAASSITIDVLDAAGMVMGTFPGLVPASRFTIMSTADLGGLATPGGSIRVSSSSAPIQVMGILSDGVNVSPQIAR
jgi:hypothetical protein